MMYTLLLMRFENIERDSKENNTNTNTLLPHK